MITCKRESETLKTNLTVSEADLLFETSMMAGMVCEIICDSTNSRETMINSAAIMVVGMAGYMKMDIEELIEEIRKENKRFSEFRKAQMSEGMI